MSTPVLTQIRKHPVLAEFCEPLPRLTGIGDPDPSGGVRRFGELLGSHPTPVSLGFHVTGDATRRWRLALDSAGFTLDDGVRDDPADIEIVVDEQTWRRLTDGELAPMDAFLSGTLRFRGDASLAGRVVRRLRRADVALAGRS